MFSFYSFQILSIHCIGDDFDPVEGGEQQRDHNGGVVLQPCADANPLFEGHSPGFLGIDDIFHLRFTSGIYRRAMLPNMRPVRHADPVRLLAKLLGWVVKMNSMVIA